MTSDALPITRLGVIGSGTMGHGIAQTAILAGVETLLYDVDEAALGRGRAGIERGLGTLVERERITAEEGEAALGRLTMTTDLDDFAAVEGVIEAAPEILALKQELFGTLDRICGQAKFLASNTSSVPIQNLTRDVSRKELVLGMHYFNPPQILKLVEVVSPLTVSTEVVELAEAFCRATGKTPVRVKDTPAFIVNRLLVPFALDAIRMLESGVATAEDIDRACQLGLGHSQGPLSTSDLVGLDVLLHVAESMFEELRDPHVAPPTMLRRMVAAGQLGRKSGRGFFNYAE